MDVLKHGRSVTYGAGVFGQPMVVLVCIFSVTMFYCEQGAQTGWRQNMDGLRNAIYKPRTPNASPKKIPSLLATRRAGHVAAH